MAFDGIMMYAVSLELSRELAGGKIEKIYQPGREELLLHIHTETGRKKLFISAFAGSARINITEQSYENPAAPPPFCMLLRKHIQGGRITGVRQVGSDRILEIYIETLDELSYSVSKKLIVEVMGKHSNISLVDIRTGKVIDAVKRISIDQSRVRQIMPGLPYEYPPKQDRIPFKEASEQEDLKKIGGISEMIRAELSHCGPGRLREILHDIESGNTSPVIYEDEKGYPLKYSAVTLRIYDDAESRHFDSVGGMIDEFFTLRRDMGRSRQMASDLSKVVRQKLKKLELKEQKLKEDLERAEDSEDLRLYGELLTAYIHEVKPGMSQITLTSYYTGEPVTIPLDRRLSPSRNAQHYFKAYSKSRTAVKEKAVQLEENEKNISYLRSVEQSISEASTSGEIEAIREELTDTGFLRVRNDRKPVKAKPSPLEMRTSKGFRVLVGRNNRENDHLTFKTANKTDLWFHTKDIPGSHVILFTEGRDVDGDTIKEAAVIAAEHSKAKDSSNVPVDYVPVRYVKKPPGAKPGMVIFTNNRTVYVNPR